MEDSASGSVMVPCVCWVPKGAAEQTPQKVQLKPEEVEELLADSQQQLMTQKEGESPGCVAQGVGGGGDIEAEYELEQYSEEEQDGASALGNTLAGLTVFSSNADDPYITLKTTDEDEDDDEANERVLPTDNLLLVGRAGEEITSVEVYVYEAAHQQCYCHHEVVLSAYPLALEWMDFDPEQPAQKGNFMCVGLISGCVEVWDLDIIDVLEPVLSLSTCHALSALRKRKSKKKRSAAVGHTSAVMGLSWNKIVRHMLASASADCSVIVWDLSTAKPLFSLPHPDKVQCVRWHPYEPQLLASGSYDGCVRLFDCKSSQSPVMVWSVECEVEVLVWDHLSPGRLLVGTEGRKVWCVERHAPSPLFQIHAHDAPITDLSLSCHVPGLLVTASADHSIKFWDVRGNAPAFLLRRDLHMDAVLCAEFCVDEPFTLAVGGQKNGFHVLHADKMPAVHQQFKERGLVIPLTADPTKDEASSSCKAEQRMEVSSTNS